MDAKAQAESATALGNSARATGVQSVALGSVAVASGNQSAALGVDAQATAQNALALGANARSTGTSGVALGAAAKAEAAQTAAIGVSARAGGVTSTALGAGAVTTGSNSVALGAGSNDAGRTNTVSVGSAGAERTISNLAAGQQNSDAMNVSQGRAIANNLGMMFDPATGAFTLPGYTINGVQYNTLSAGVIGLGNQVGATQAQVVSLQQQLNSGQVGVVQQYGGTNGAIGVGTTTGGTVVNMNGQAGNRVVTGVANGAIGAASTDTVTGQQLHATNQQVVSNTASIQTLGTAQAAQGLAIGTLQNGVASLTTSFQTFHQQVSTGNVGLVQQLAGNNGTVTIAAVTGGTTVSMSGTDGARTVSGVAAGAVTATSQDAVNGSQLHATNQRVAAAETVSAPSKPRRPNRGSA